MRPRESADSRVETPSIAAVQAVFVGQSNLGVGVVFCVEHEQVSFANELLLLLGELHAVLGDGLCRVLEGEQAGGGELTVGQRKGFQLCHVGAAQTCGLLRRAVPG